MKRSKLSEAQTSKQGKDGTSVGFAMRCGYGSAHNPSSEGPCEGRGFIASTH